MCAWRAGEMMDAVSGSNTNAGKHVLTSLTLALLQDTGWYARGSQHCRDLSNAAG